jgi:hypothetical protein
MKACLIATALTLLGCLAVPTPAYDDSLLDGPSARACQEFRDRFQESECAPFLDFDGSGSDFEKRQLQVFIQMGAD